MVVIVDHEGMRMPDATVFMPHRTVGGRLDEGWSIMFSFLQRVAVLDRLVPVFDDFGIVPGPHDGCYIAIAAGIQAFS
ncbi:hypothetical protein GRZ55_19280 [Chelativorans sp. ZYF759]|uniref:hypothetical protein n=1 Tax=Chelativorans sp. ZYF759 TaxID=2692213 RepID=UPI00145C7A04|nr:hypothetical protein [Chelativorans sp. ZYF759]NMG41391.1 hypothetical protein [Chelativorans sp. ZYF759]